MINTPSQQSPNIGEKRSGLLRIGDMAPNFQARSTKGPIELADYKGQWVLLMSHPGDFTPVCTSEFIELAQQSDAFDVRNCALLALSVDSLYAHLAWIKAIYDNMGVKIDFPIIEDSALTLAQAYGMTDIHAEDAVTVRATFFIDPTGMIRALTYYPATIGRSVSEMLRMLDALQENDKSGYLLPEGWTKGEKCLFQPPHNMDDELARQSGDWFFQFTPDEKE